MRQYYRGWCKFKREDGTAIAIAYTRDAWTRQHNVDAGWVNNLVIAHSLINFPCPGCCSKLITNVFVSRERYNCDESKANLPAMRRMVSSVYFLRNLIWKYLVWPWKQLQLKKQIHKCRNFFRSLSWFFSFLTVKL